MTTSDEPIKQNPFPADRFDRTGLHPRPSLLSPAPYILLTAQVILALFSLARCASPPAVFTVTGEALGTYYTITVASPPDSVDKSTVRILADETLEEIDRLMSTWREDSELSRFNRYEGTGGTGFFFLSPDIYTVFQMAQRISENSGGAFDITVGPLVNAWGFGPDVFDQPPEDETIAALLERVGYQKLTLHRRAVSKAHPKIYCDLSAIAKGYAVDAVAAALEEAAVTRYMIEVGGEIRVAGKNPDGNPWRLGIEKPSTGERQLYAVVHLEHGALATSGNYRNMYEVDGKLYSHTIDPHTGYPVQHRLASASVIHPSCAMADGYATALMALGHEKALELAEKHHLAVMLIVAGEDADSFETITTAKFDGYLADNGR